MMKCVPVVDVPVRNRTSPVFDPEAVVISQARTKNRNSSVSVNAPGFHVGMVDVTSTVVDSAVEVDPIFTPAPASSWVPLLPSALADFHSRIRTRPLCDEAVLARIANTAVQVPDANVPFRGAGVLKELPACVVGESLDPGFDTLDSSENVPVACFVPALKNEDSAEAIFPTVQPSVRDAAGWSTPSTSAANPSALFPDASR